MRPSRTAYAVAKLRAGHQILDGGSIFLDPYACSILGEEPEDIAASQREQPDSAKSRTYMALRSRIGEDWLQTAYNRGVRQVVILGAGFDTFGLRNTCPNLKVFEVDHAATQDWKRERLTVAKIEVPPTLVFASVNFSTDDLMASLMQFGFEEDLPAFYLWLGVVPYLTREAVVKTLASIAKTKNAEVVFDYTEPLDNYADEQRPYVQAMQKRVAELGEPWLSYFDPSELAASLNELGFQELEDLDHGGIVNWVSKKKSLENSVGPHMIRARRV